MNTTTSFTLISADIDKDLSSKGIEMPLDDTYTLICDKYTISRENVISQTHSITGKTIPDYSAQGLLTIRAKGNVSISDSKSFITLLSELSSRKEPFTLIIGNDTFENIILKEFSADIEKYKINSVCTLLFIQM